MNKLGPKFGHIVTEETRKKISKAFTGKKFTEEHKNKISLANKGKVRKSESIEKYKKAAKKRRNYKGGISKIDEIERDKFKKRIQKKVLARDSFTCQICNKVGGELHVDHIQPWSKYVELRFDLNNCRTLCRSCHYLITYKKPIKKGTMWGMSFWKKGEKIR